MIYGLWLITCRNLELQH